MKQYKFQLLLLMCFIFISTETTKLEDYCWRDYEGTIPPDALPAHQLRRDKRPAYVGQALFKDKLIGGKIYANDSKIYFEYFDVEYSTAANVKILCTSQPENFQWIETRHTDVLQLPRMLLIKGGFEPNCDMYVGRVEINGEMNPGKVICCAGQRDCFGLYTTNNKKGSLHGDFQILRYNENPSLDVRSNFDSGDNKIKHDKTRYSKCKKLVINLFN